MHPPTRPAARPALQLPTHARARPSQCHRPATPSAAQPDPADWERSPEWYGTQGGGWGRGAGAVVYAAASPVGNARVTVTVHPASVEALPGAPAGAPPPEWRVMRFGEATRQSVALVDALPGDPSARAARPGALAFEYVKTVVACCLASFPAGLVDAAVGGAGVGGPRPPSILCIGVGGGAVPLALASLFPGAAVAGVDLCPAVLGGAGAMGLTAAAGVACPNLALSLGDGVAALEGADPGSVDLLVVDAFDGDDAVPAALASPGGAGLVAAAAALHPAHGVLVINLHAGPKPGPVEWLGRLTASGPRPPTFVVREDGTGPGAVALATASAWADAVLGGSGGGGCAAMVGVRRQANAVAVVARGGGGRDGGAAGAASAARALASRAALPLPYDVGDRAGYGWWEVPRRG